MWYGVSHDAYSNDSSIVQDTSFTHLAPYRNARQPNRIGRTTFIVRYIVACTGRTHYSAARRQLTHKFLALGNYLFAYHFVIDPREFVWSFCIFGSCTVLSELYEHRFFLLRHIIFFVPVCCTTPYQHTHNL